MPKSVKSVKKRIFVVYFLIHIRDPKVLAFFVTVVLWHGKESLPKIHLNLCCLARAKRILKQIEKRTHWKKIRNGTIKPQLLCQVWNIKG